MEDGSFNCVSSAVLYMIFSRSIGIPVVGIGTEDHAFCAAVLPGGNVDVETTSIYGFDPGKKKEFHDAFGNVTGYSYVPPSNYAARSELSQRQLIALILQNRISLLESQNRYEEALELAADRYAMAPGSTTKSHLYRGAVNYAALLNERREYSGAIDFLAQFVDTYGWSDSVRDIYRVLHYNRVVLFIQSGDFEEAIDTLSTVEVASWIEPEVVRSLRSQVAERILAKELPVLTSEEGFELLGVLRDDGLVSPERYTDYAVMLTSSEAEELASAGDYLAAAAVIEQAIGRLGSDRRLITARDAYRYNFAVEAHNTFAALFNDGKYDEAEKLLEESISRVPDSDILLQDRALLKRILAE
jgi:tetratricopeptide (TPR) repeat protein